MDSSNTLINTLNLSLATEIFSVSVTLLINALNLFVDSELLNVSLITLTKIVPTSNTSV